LYSKLRDNLEKFQTEQDSSKGTMKAAQTEVYIHPKCSMTPDEKEEHACRRASREWTERRPQEDGVFVKPEVSTIQ
jgi:hypothetical protein